MIKTILLALGLFFAWVFLYFGVLHEPWQTSYMAEGGTYDGWTLNAFLLNLMVGVVIGGVSSAIAIVRDWW